jgi:apolipoprotein N-acyltransferase
MESAREESVRAMGYSSGSLSLSRLFSGIAEDFLYSGTSALFLLVANLFPGYWYFSFVALFPFLWKVNQASARQAFRLGFLFGLTFFTFWSLDAFSLAPVSTIIKIICGSLIFALWGWAVGLIKQYFGFNPVIISGLWVLFELALIRLGYNSGLLTHSTPSTPFFLRLATLFGFGIISFIIVLLNSLLIKAIEYAAKTLKAQIIEFSISELTWDLAMTCHLFSQRFFFVPQLRGPPIPPM